jgi:hypothetical protein
MVSHSKEYEDLVENLNLKFKEIIDNKDSPDSDLVIQLLQDFLLDLNRYRDLIEKSMKDMIQLIDLLKSQSGAVIGILEDVSTSIEIVSIAKVKDPANVILNRDSFIRKFHNLRDGFNAQKMMIEMFFEDQKPNET